MRRIGEALHVSDQAALVIHLGEDQQRRLLVKQLRWVTDDEVEDIAP
jgi:phosphopantetheine adenylyltransferase